MDKIEAQLARINNIIHSNGCLLQKNTSRRDSLKMIQNVSAWLTRYILLKVDRSSSTDRPTKLKAFPFKICNLSGHVGDMVNHFIRFEKKSALGNRLCHDVTKNK